MVQDIFSDKSKITKSLNSGDDLNMMRVDFFQS